MAGGGWREEKSIPPVSGMQVSVVLTERRSDGSVMGGERGRPAGLRAREQSFLIRALTLRTVRFDAVIAALPAPRGRR